MRARLRSPIRMLLVLQADERTGRVLWRGPSGERALWMHEGLVVGTEGQPESFLQYLARAWHISPAELGRIERRVQDLFLPVEDEVARATHRTREDLAAARRAFTLEQVADLCLTDDPVELRFRVEEIPIPGAPCRVPPTTALADLLVDRVTRGVLPLAFPEGPLRPTRLFPRLGPLLEAAFPWPLPLPQAGGESASELLERVGADRAPALWLLVSAGLLAEEAAPAERTRRAAVLPAIVLPATAAADPRAACEALRQRLAVDPFHQDAIEALERLAAEEGWPEVLVDMQERLAAKAPPPQRGFHLLRLAALAEIAGLPAERVAEIVMLGRRSLPRDLRLVCARAFHLLARGEVQAARNLLRLASIPWPAALDAVLAPRATLPGVPAVPPVETVPPTPREPRLPAASASVVATTEAPSPSPPTRAPTPPAPDRQTTESSDGLGSLMAALEAGDDDTLHAWLQDSLPRLPRVRQASQAILDAARASGNRSTDHVARFARALGRALDQLPPADGSPAADTLRAELFLQLAELLKPIDIRAAVVAAERAIAAAPEYEPAIERFERLAREARDPEAYVRGFACVEERIEGAHNRWAFAYRQGQTLETEFARNDLALQAYLRALEHQPRTGAVLTAIERLAKLEGSVEPLATAYRTLAAATDGAQRAYWRSRLVAIGASPSLGDDSGGWTDMLDDSVPDLAKTAEPPATPPSPATASEEPARRIEEALLRATPALGIPILAVQGKTEAPPGDDRAALSPPPPEPTVTETTAEVSTPETPEVTGAAAPQPLSAFPETPATPESGLAESAAVATEPEPRLAESTAAATEPEPLTRDVSWLDDDVEMLIEYPPEEEAAGPAVVGVRIEEEAAGPAVVGGRIEEEAAGPAGVGGRIEEEVAGPRRHPAVLGVEARVAASVVEPPEVVAARQRLATDVTDLDALRALHGFWKRTGSSPGGQWAAESVLSVFDRTMWPTPPPPAVASPAEVVLARCGPWAAQRMHRASALVWEHCAATFAEDRGASVRPEDQVSPLGNDPLARGIAECSERLAFFRFQLYRRPAHSELQVLRTRPPSVLAGTHLQPVPGHPADLTMLAAAVARCLPEHVLPATLSPTDREALVQGLLCAFGPPGCMPHIPPRAATVAQDLWHFLPSRTQALLREEFAGADATVASEWLTEVHARCLLLAVHVSRDIRTALRLGLAIDAAIPVDRSLSESAFRDALRWSSVTRRLLRAVLSEPFWLGFFR